MPAPAQKYAPGRGPWRVRTCWCSMAKRLRSEVTGRHRRSFRSQILHAAPVIVLITAVTAVADRQWHLLDSFHFFALDTFVATAAPESGDVVIVNISDDDYRQTFKSRSPLNPRPLQELIDSVLKQSPGVVGIDIPTGDADDAPLLRHYERTTTPIVWVRDAFALDASAARTQTWQLDSVLGAQNPPAGIRTGLSLFPRDADRFVRGYYRHVPLKTTDGDIAPASFAWAIVQTFCSSPAGARNTMCTALLGRERQEAGDPGEHELLRFNFAGDRYTFRKVPAKTVAAAPILACACAGSYVAFRGFGYWASFVPVGAGVWLHQLYDRAHDAREIRKELEECRKRLGSL